MLRTTSYKVTRPSQYRTTSPHSTYHAGQMKFDLYVGASVGPEVSIAFRIFLFDMYSFSFRSGRGPLGTQRHDPLALAIPEQQGSAEGDQCRCSICCQSHRPSLTSSLQVACCLATCISPISRETLPLVSTTYTIRPSTRFLPCYHIILFHIFMCMVLSPDRQRGLPQEGPWPS